MIRSILDLILFDRGPTKLRMNLHDIVFERIHLIGFEVFDTPTTIMDDVGTYVFDNRFDKFGKPFFI